MEIYPHIRAWHAWPRSAFLPCLMGHELFQSHREAADSSIVRKRRNTDGNPRRELSKAIAEQWAWQREAGNSFVEKTERSGLD